MNGNKVIIFSAPSGAGKTTLVRHLLDKFPALEFSISATSRAPRGLEGHGVDYFFLTPSAFAAKASKNEFVEWEEVYPGLCYGTLKSEVERIWAKGNVIAFDIDVRGGVNLKKLYDKQALSVFVCPPSVEILEQRLKQRATDTPEAIAKRIKKAEEELSYAPQFDVVIVNDDLDKAKAEAERVIGEWLNE